MENSSGWVKKTPFGNYRDPKQNGKHRVRNTEQYNLVQLCRRMGIKHPGSKRMSTLRSHK